MHPASCLGKLLRACRCLQGGSARECAPQLGWQVLLASGSVMLPLLLLLPLMLPLPLPLRLLLLLLLLLLFFQAPRQRRVSASEQGSEG